MTQQIVCDECGKSIDQSQPYYELTGSKVQMSGEPLSLQTVEPAKQMHYHVEHLEETVLEPAPVEGEPEPPYPGVDIGAMTIQQALAWADDDPDKLQWALDQENAANEPRRSLTDQLQNKLDALVP